jgi:uncharacterized lipoprotein YehR (DUF1307 family)
MKKNKLITLIIAGVMTLSVLSGCGKAEETTAPVAPAETTAPATTPAAPEKTITPYTASAADFD